MLDDNPAPLASKRSIPLTVEPRVNQVIVSLGQEQQNEKYTQTNNPGENNWDRKGLRQVRHDNVG